MQKPVTVAGEEVILATITVGTLEEIELAGKKGRAFNVGLIAASIRSSGDKLHGTEEWVRALPAFNGPFIELLTAANEVNGFTMGEPEPAAPALAATA
jgi:hypothetical protein